MSGAARERERDREWRREEVAAHRGPEDALLVIDNVVYDVTEWLGHHPGGAEVLLERAGGDASRCFHAVGHSADARDWMRRFAVGAVAAAERRPVERPPARLAPGAGPLTARALWAAAGPPALLAVVATLLYWGLF